MSSATFGIKKNGRNRVFNLADVVKRTSSIAALELFKADPNRFDLAISDMTMPHLPGEELARKRLGVRPDIPIIICTGYSARIRRESAGRMGIRDRVMKPLSMETLSQTVRRVLDASKNMTPGRQAADFK